MFVLNILLSAVVAGMIRPGTVAGPKGPAFDCYRSFNAEIETTRYFADSIGIGNRCFFASNTLNSMGEPYCEYDPIWVGYDTYRWENLDRQVEDLLAANGMAKFVCMIDLNTPYWATRWYKTDSFYHISALASDEDWYYNTNLWLDSFLDYAESKYGEHIFAYVLSGGCTSEWYETDTAANCRSRAEAIAYIIGRYAGRARGRLGPGKQLGVFFGYYFASTDNLLGFGHLSYEKVLTDPNIDFIIAPGSYSSRRMGQGSGSQALFGTAMLHGKRLLHEIDHRPHGYYRGGSDWDAAEEDICGCLREACFAIINHADLWWFDMWGHFYDNPKLRDAIASAHKIFERFKDDNSASVSQILYVADPESLLSAGNLAFPRACTEEFRNNLARTGMPYDCYSLNDLPLLDLSQYKVIMLPATFEITPEKEALLKRHVCSGGRMVVWSYAPGISDGVSLKKSRVRKWAGVPFGTDGIRLTEMGDWSAVYASGASMYTSEELKRLCREAGVHEYLDGSEVVYANERLLCVHCKDGGEKTVRLPAAVRRVTELFSGRTVATDTSSFTFDFSSPDTRLFLLE